MRYATTFGASKIYDEATYKEGVELGKFLANRGYVVKCGGYLGLMEAVSKGVYQAGGEILGIGLKEFENERSINKYLTKKIIAEDLFERLKLLTKDSEMFVVQQGSIGTLNELFLVWALKYSLGRQFRICLIGKRYQSLKNCDFIPQTELHHLEIYNTLDEFKKSFP